MQEPDLTNDNVIIAATNHYQSARSLRPFIKWAGGKRWLVKNHLDYFPNIYQRYFEPFLGGGAVFFGLRPENALISDQNSELINAYIQVRDSWQEIAKGLERMQNAHSKEHYYEVRLEDPVDKIEKAIRFLYLNRTCWNGLYRVNRLGKFNVPIGTKDRVDMGDDFETIAKVLKYAEILTLDFETSIDRSGLNDLVYIDPPYTVKHKNNGFLKYNEEIFSWSDQMRLKGAVERAVGRGASVIVSNADHESIRELYKGLGEIISLKRASVISGLNAGRGWYDEVLIRCY